jgi:RNA polymerase sigma-70 factor, ECF subfamily
MPALPFDRERLQRVKKMTANDQAFEFLALWNASSRQIYSFILSVLPNWADADDAFQETGKALWERFGEFRPGSNFTSWACRIAFMRTRELRRRQRRGPVLFSDAFVNTAEYRCVNRAETLGARHAALSKCMEKLNPRELALLQSRYEDGGTTANTAARLGRSINAVYKAINRIHESLFYCIERTIHQESA